MILEITILAIVLALLVFFLVISLFPIDNKKLRKELQLDNLKITVKEQEEGKLLEEIEELNKK